MVQLAGHYGRSPDRITLEEVRSFLHYLIAERKLAFSSCNQNLAGIRFFYRYVPGQNKFDLRVPAKRCGKLPEPFSRSEIERLLKAPTNAKHRVLLMTCYATGRRASELVHYLGRYTHRVAISNHRILDCRDDQVRFHHRLDQVRRLLGTAGQPVADPPPQTAAEWMRLLLGLEFDRCPVCGQRLHQESLPPIPPFQTSARLRSTTPTSVRGPPPTAAPSAGGQT